MPDDIQNKTKINKNTGVLVLRILTGFLFIFSAWLIVLMLIEFPIQEKSLFAYPGSDMTGHEQYILEKRIVQKVNDGRGGIRVADIAGRETVELDSCLSFASDTENYSKSEFENTFIVSLSSAGSGMVESSYETRKLKAMCDYSARDVLVSSFGGGRLFDGILRLPTTSGMESGVILPERDDFSSESFSFMVYRAEYIDEGRVVLFAEPIVSTEKRTYADTTEGWSGILGLDAIFVMEAKEELTGYMESINVTKHLLSPDCLDERCGEVILPDASE